MTVRMRHTSGHTKNRRSHHGLTTPRLSKCVKCDSFHLRHRMCEVCGTYRERQVIDINAKITRKNEKRVAKMKELGLDPNKKQQEPEILDSKKLSKKA
ncbi:MAG: 50S ribosomal protein L32 [Patescibacteria group bacterium]